jgi:hypothetical protein
MTLKRKARNESLKLGFLQKTSPGSHTSEAKKERCAQSKSIRCFGNKPVKKTVSKRQRKSDRFQKLICADKSRRSTNRTCGLELVSPQNASAARKCEIWFTQQWPRIWVSETRFKAAQFVQFRKSTVNETFRFWPKYRRRKAGMY